MSTKSESDAIKVLALVSVGGHGVAIATESMSILSQTPVCSIGVGELSAVHSIKMSFDKGLAESYLNSSVADSLFVFANEVQGAAFVKVGVMAGAESVKVTFDPVSVDSVRSTRELNRVVQLGFVPPTISSR